jgi:hypothetical protein
MSKYLVKRSIVATAVLAAAATIGRDALACGACPAGCTQSDTQDVFFFQPPQGQGFFIAESWKNFNAGEDDASGVFFQTGYDGAANSGWFTVTPLASNILCVDAEGFQNGTGVPGCFQECDTGNFGDGGNCTTVNHFETAACVNNDTGFGPPDQFLFDVTACNC